VTDALTSLLAFIVAISVLVAVHEFGHYLVGRWCGMKVLRFSIGFGRPIWTWIGGADRTEYCISTLPLGGYVKFLDEREGPVDPADRNRAFNNRPVPARIAVLLAGPFFNFLFAVLAYWVLFVNGVPTMKPAIGTVEPGSYADEAGLLYGDRIMEIAGRKVVDWEGALVGLLETMVSESSIEMRVEGADGSSRDVRLDVGDDASRLTEPGMLFEGLGFVPWQPPAIVGGLSDDGAARAAGILEGDRITAIDGEPIGSFGDLQRVVSARPDQEVVVRVLRGSEPLDFELTLGADERDGARSGLLGVSVSQSVSDYWFVRKYGVLGSVSESLQQTWASTAFTVNMFARMLTGDVSIKNISGPINIAQYAGDSASAGLNQFLRFLALVSISLGVINLLPVPVLDGGQIVYQTIEGLKGSPLSMRAQIVGQQVGILALLLLMSFAFYNDIARILAE